jgi:hypothetical protein
MARRQMAAGVYLGGAAVAVDPCPAVGPSAVVQVRGIRDEVAAFPSQGLARSNRDTQERARARERMQAAADARAEAEWRRAFRELRTDLARLEELRRSFRDALDRQTDAISIDRARRDLPALEREIHRVREALDDLDRRASNESIPQEWRR